VLLLRRTHPLAPQPPRPLWCSAPLWGGARVGSEAPLWVRGEGMGGAKQVRTYDKSLALYLVLILLMSSLNETNLLKMNEVSNGNLKWCSPKERSTDPSVQGASILLMQPPPPCFAAPHQRAAAPLLRLAGDRSGAEQLF
jgi:hypothetical protein